MKTELALCALLALAFSAAVVAQPVRDEFSTGPRNAVVLIIRHAEDADSGKGLSPLETYRFIACAGAILPKLTLSRVAQEGSAHSAHFGK